MLVEYHGRMQAVPGKSYFVGEKSGQPVYPAGSSLFWSSASSRYYTRETVAGLKKQFNAQLIRAAMTAWSGWSDGYTTYPERYAQHASTIADAAIEQGMYVIIDWHCEGDNSNYVNQAKTFFRDMAQRYNSYPNVIYEIWNEPTKQSWNQYIRPYCVAVIEEIRKWDKKNLILCGTENWSQKVEDAAKNPIQDVNVGYVLHFYSNLHGPWLYQNKAKLGVPIFVSEWGTPGQHANTEGFVKWLEDNKVPHASWALNNKAEPLSYLQPGCTDIVGPWDEEKELTVTGKIFLNLISKWKGNQISSVPSQPAPVPSQPAPVPSQPAPVPSQSIEPFQVLLEAETFRSASSGVKTQPCQDVGGGLNVGWIKDRSWMTYNQKLSKGSYKVEYRLASAEGGTLRLDTDKGRVVFGILEIPNTGGWQKWSTFEQTIRLEKDLSGFGIFALKGGWNLNWIKFTRV